MKRLPRLALTVILLSSVTTPFAVVRDATSAPPRPSRPPTRPKATPRKQSVPTPTPTPTRPAPPAVPVVPPVGSPLPNLGQANLNRFNLGKTAFLTAETPLDGVGPVFTENACVKCHNDGAPGGAGERLVTRFGRILNGRFDPMIEFGGPQVQDRGIGRFNGVNFVGEVVPPQATIVAHRRTVAIFGMGMVDAVPDGIFLALAQHQAAVTPATAGRASHVVDPVSGQDRVGKFGWKAQQPSLFAFAGDAYVNELGVTTPLFPQENCPQGNCSLLTANPARTQPNDLDNEDVQAFTDFMSMLAPPPRGPVGSNERAGELIFHSIGCADCHLPEFQTGTNPIPALNAVSFFPYSDFLLHDMGSLGDGIVQNTAGPREMRTAPLWGLRFERTLLHDGRASNADQAILAHDGQARPSRNHYATLGASQKAQLQAFLNSL